MNLSRVTNCLTFSVAKTVLWLLLCPTLLCAQTTTSDTIGRKRSYLLLRDGSVVQGQIIRQDSRIITVRQRGGVMTFIERDQLVRVSTSAPKLPAQTVSVSQPGQASATSAPYTFFMLKDGVQIEGTLIRQDSTMMTVQKRNGQLTYFEPELLERIDSIRIETATQNTPSAIFPNRFSPWLLTEPTAFNPEKGMLYVRSLWLLRNAADYGITRFWSVGASFVIPVPNPFVSDNEEVKAVDRLWRSVQVSSRLSVPVGARVRLGLNATYQPSALSGLTYRGGIWTGHALASTGSSQHNVTLGYGLVRRGQMKQYEYWWGATLPPSSTAIQYNYVDVPLQPFVTLGIMQKVGPGLTLLSDNRLNLGDRSYVFDDPGERATVGFGFRIDRRRHAFDLGVYSRLYRKDYALDGRTVQLLPYLGYNLLIGRNG